jgi:hypothetical protein
MSHYIYVQLMIPWPDFQVWHPSSSTALTNAMYQYNKLRFDACSVLLASAPLPAGDSLARALASAPPAAAAPIRMVGKKQPLFRRELRCISDTLIIFCLVLVIHLSPEFTPSSRQSYAKSELADPYKATEVIADLWMFHLYV